MKAPRTVMEMHLACIIQMASNLKKGQLMV